tara:strand:- start:77158 stop:78450 length:1293 start_codon:yes stop_codon:yes gene_type:complete
LKSSHRLSSLLALPLLFASAHYAYAPANHWSKWSIDASGNGADGVHTGDINRDGLIDVVSGWEESGQVKLYLNPGLGKLRTQAGWPGIDISGGLEIDGIEDAAFADLDLDGHIDTVLSSIEGDTRSLGLHWFGQAPMEASRSWQAISLTPGHRAGYMKARAAQIDGIGGADIVAGTKTMGDVHAGIYWFASPPDTHATDPVEWREYFVGEIDVKTVTLVLKDMDADSLVDIVYSGRNGVGWFRNPGHSALVDDPANAQWERIVVATTGSEYTFCDHDGNGLEDLIVTTSKTSGMVAKWLQRLDDSGRHWREFPVMSDDLRPGLASGRKFVLKGVACGFVDDDGVIDIVFTASGYGHGVFMMSPRAEISAGKPWEVTYLSLYADRMKYDNLQLVDVDGDGDLDVVTSEEGQGIFSSGDGVLWFENPRNSSE